MQGILILLSSVCLSFYAPDTKSSFLHRVTDPYPPRYAPKPARAQNVSQSPREDTHAGEGRRDYLEHHHRIPSDDHHPNPHLLPTRLLLYRFVEDDVQEDLNQRKDVNDRAPNTPD